MTGNIHKAPNPPQVMAQIFFGANISNPLAAEVPDDLCEVPNLVSDAEFARFLGGYVTPSFPGFTVTTAQGYWKGKPETVRVLSLLAADSNSFRDIVRQFAERYKTEFAQDAVAYAFTPCEFALDCWPFGPVKAYHRPGKGY